MYMYSGLIPKFFLPARTIMHLCLTFEPRFFAGSKVKHIHAHNFSCVQEKSLGTRELSINRTHFSIPNTKFVYIQPLKNQDTSLIRTLSSVPRVPGLFSY